MVFRTHARDKSPARAWSGGARRPCCSSRFAATAPDAPARGQPPAARRRARPPPRGRGDGTMSTATKRLPPAAPTWLERERPGGHLEDDRGPADLASSEGAGGAGRGHDEARLEAAHAGSPGATEEPERRAGPSPREIRVSGDRSGDGLVAQVASRAGRVGAARRPLGGGGLGGHRGARRIARPRRCHRRRARQAGNHGRRGDRRPSETRCPSRPTRVRSMLACGVRRTYVCPN